MSGDESNRHRESGARREPPDSDQLLARCVAAIERGEMDIVARICAEHPEHEAALRLHLSRLGHMGMLAKSEEVERHSVEERLQEILQLPRSAQEAALAALCREHPELAAGLRERYDLVVRLRALGPRAAATRTGAATADTAAETIGPFRILGVLGEGGMGTVFLAEQREPVRRRVALKVIKLGMDTKQILARFQTERQALAMMEHDCIARVLDAGATGDGRPYFVMEYVKGAPITDYCDAQRLRIPERLALFRQVCAGVQHAHQKGVIHRDLKPSNVLVTLQSGQPVPKIIDFGLARATDHHLVEATLYTELGQMLGTPEYMSPEQAQVGSLDIDTRTDIYSLGVLLYELLTGALPFHRRELREAGLHEIQRRIREEDPPKPSTRLTPPGEGSREQARKRCTDLRSLASSLRGDLDWITMKALEKDRTRRYGSAEALAEDLRRHLEHEPVDAGPPSGLYRLRKFLRKRRGPVAAGVAVFLALAGGLAVAWWQYGVARSNENAARRAEREANRQKSISQQQERQASESEARAKREAQKALWQSYLANIVAAEGALRLGEVKNAQARLEAAPAALRNWEWRFLRAASDRSLRHLGECTSSISALSPDGSCILLVSGATARVWNLATGSQIAELSGHGRDITAAAFDPSGTRIVTGSEDLTVRLWTIRGEPIAVLRGHQVVEVAGVRTRGIWTVAFSPDGARVLSAGDMTARLWDSATGEPDLILRGHRSVVTAASFSPDGSRVATGSWYDGARIWSVTTGECIAVLRHRNSVLRTAFSPDGASLATACSVDPTVRLWRVEDGLLLHELLGHSDSVSDVAYSPDGSRIATASEDRTARLWDAASGKPLLVLDGHRDAVNTIAFNDDGSRLVSVSRDKTARIYDARTGRSLAVLEEVEAVEQGRFRPDGTRVFTVSLDGVRVWDVAPRPGTIVLQAHRNWINTAAFSSDGRLIVTASRDGTAQVFSAETGEERATLRGHRAGINTASFSPDVASVVTSSDDGTARIWDTTTGTLLHVLRGHTGHVFGAAFDPSGRRIVTASVDKTARVWDSATGEQVLEITEHDGKVNTAVFSPDGERIVTASADNTACIVEVASGRVLAVLRGGDAVRAASFSPDGRFVLASSDDRTVRIWKATGGDPVAVLRGHGSFIRKVALSRDGSRIVTASKDRTARVWDAQGRLLHVLNGHQNGVNDATFSADGTRVLTASNDRTVRIWDTATGSLMATIRGHEKGIVALALSSDGTRLLTASHDGTGRVIDAVPYARRYEERRVRESLRPQALQLVRRLSAEARDLVEVAAAVRAEEKASSAVRAVALELVTRSASEIRGRVHDLRAAKIFRRDMVAALQGDASLSRVLRGQAVRFAQTLDESPDVLVRLAWSILERADAESESLATAHRAAAVAWERSKEPAILRILAAAEFRAGDPNRAVRAYRSLRRLDIRAGKPGLGPIDCAFFALALKKLGRDEQAEAERQRLHAMMKNDEYRDDAESRAWLAEVEAQFAK